MSKIASAKVHKKKRIYQRLPIHILRITASLEPLNLQTEAPFQKTICIILNDFSTTGMGFFSPIFMDFGLQIKITIEKPLFMSSKASVVWCKEYQTSNKIISHHGKFTYRMGVEFLPDTPEEKESIQQFFNLLIQKNVLTKR